jgi:hypothetical protein
MGMPKVMPGVDCHLAQFDSSPNIFSKRISTVPVVTTGKWIHFADGKMRRKAF